MEYYLTNKSLLKELTKYHETGKISKELHNMIFLLCKRIIQKTLFYRRICEQSVKTDNLEDNYLDVIHQGYIDCIEKVGYFKMDKTNPFSFFTTVIMNSFRDYFSYEKKHEILKQISQNEYEHRFLMKYGFKPIHKIDDENN